MPPVLTRLPRYLPTSRHWRGTDHQGYGAGAKTRNRTVFGADFSATLVSEPIFLTTLVPEPIFWQL